MTDELVLISKSKSFNSLIVTAETALSPEIFKRAHGARTWYTVILHKKPFPHQKESLVFFKQRFKPI